ncbi:MAG TPA: GNAT family N-acetyltransferase [Thermomicrobiales bacterium]
MIVYQSTTVGISPKQLHGFFVGWPNPPSPETHLRILEGSTVVELALDEESTMIVGFVTAISDGVSCAYIPHLEVLPAYQGRGIGTNLMTKLLTRLREHYMIDLLCDQSVQSFYAAVGMQPAVGMCVRNYGHQAGIPQQHAVKGIEGCDR